VQARVVSLSQVNPYCRTRLLAMRYAYLQSPPANGIFVKRIPMEKKSANSTTTPPSEAIAAADAAQGDAPVASDAPVAQADETPAPPSTKLTDLLRAWIANVQWDQEVVYDAEDQTGYLNAHIPIDGTDYRLYVVAEEGPQYLGLTLYNPLFIPEDRTIEALRFVNQINQRQRVGRMAIVSNHLQYRALIDVESCEPGIDVLKNLYRNGYYAMKFWMPHLGKLIFAGVTAQQIHDELLAEESATRQ
jgi:hypothetical protein